MNPKKKKGKWKKRILLLILLGLLIAGLMVFVILPTIRKATQVNYDTFTTRRGDLSNSLSFNGSMSVKNSETLSCDAAGTVRKIYVKESEPVQKNTRLIRMSTGEMLRASFDGQVNQIMVDEGDEVAANDNLIQIVDFSQMTVSMRVDEFSISSVYVGQPCSITFTALERSMNATIDHINRISSSSGNTAYYTVSCDIDVAEDVLPGMQVKVTIPLDQAENAILLSKDALSFAQNNSAYVLVKEDGKEMVRREVTVGVSNDRFVEITSGLSEGETVYKVAASKKEAAGGLFSGLAGMGTNQNSTGTQQRNRNYGNGGNYGPGGGNYGGPGGNMGGGMSNRR